MFIPVTVETEYKIESARQKTDKKTDRKTKIMTDRLQKNRKMECVK